MKKLAFTAAILFCLCSCTRDIDYEYAGWADVINETSQTVTLVSDYLVGEGLVRTETATINPGETYKRYMLWDYNYDTLSCATKHIIILADGTEIVCEQRAEDSWSRRFYDNYESRKSVERSGFDKHNIIIETYHIDNTLIELWRKGH